MKSNKVLLSILLIKLLRYRQGVYNFNIFKIDDPTK